MEYTHVGLDVHKNSIIATALDAEGRNLGETRLGPSDAELIEYLRALPGKKRVVLEACIVWEHVYDAALTVAESVTLAHPYKTRLISEASLKTDKVDSRALAELGRLNGVPRAYAPDLATRALRQLVRERVHVKRLEVSVRNRIYSHLLRRGLPFEDRLLLLKRKREDLRRHGIPAVDRGLELLKDIERNVALLDQRVSEAVEVSPEARLLRTIPGVGELTALALVAELCPISRFANAEKVSSYLGLVPTVHQSGETSYHGRLKDDCNGYVRALLVQSAWAHRFKARRSDVSALARRVARRRGQSKAVVAAAHKLLKIAYAVLRRGTPYTPERPRRVANAVAPRGGHEFQSAGHRSGTGDRESSSCGTGRE